MQEPHIAVALTPDLLLRFLPDGLRDQLSRSGRVSVLHEPGDLRAAGGASVLATADVLVSGWGTGSVDDAVLATAPRLRAVVHTGGSVRSVVTPDCYLRGIAVSSQAAANARPVAEYAAAMIVLAAKGAIRAATEYRRARSRYDVYSNLPGYGIHATTVGIIGASATGRRTAELLRPYEFHLLLADPTVDAATARRLGADLVSLPQLMAASRVVSLHAPLLPSTVGMVTSGLLASMPDEATFLNTARGALVDQPALVRELASGRIHAVLDVTDPEIPEPDSPLWDLPNVVLTPHIAGSIGVELHRLGAGAVDEVRRFLSGLAFRHPVTAADYERLA